MNGDVRRYLAAKRTVDDRALDRRLVEDLRAGLAERADDGPLRVLEVGAGIGTMVTRLVEWGVLPEGRTDYTAVDVQDGTVAGVREHLREWAGTRPATVEGSGDRIVLETADRQVAVDPVAAEATDYAEGTDAAYDILIGAALLDVFDLDGLGSLLGTVAPGGYYYFPITFDGATRFRPAHPADRTVEGHYHGHMDHKPGGSSRAGGDVLAGLRAIDGVALTGVAGSDWIVRPVDGTYPAEEAYFLRYILDTVETAVGEMVDGESPELSSWVARRREQVDAAELVYLTHQLDFLGRVEEPSAARSGPSGDNR